MEFLIPIAMFAIIPVIVYIVSDKNTEKLKIRVSLDEGKLGEGFAELSKELLAALNNDSSIKWGFVLSGIGLALLIGYWIPDIAGDQVTAGLMAIFAGLGLILYHFLYVK